jgi:hypothetical protein
MTVPPYDEPLIRGASLVGTAAEHLGASDPHHALPRPLRRGPPTLRLPLTHFRLRRKRSLDPSRLYWNRSWVVAGAAGATAGLAGLHWFGWRLAAIGVLVGALGYSHAAFGEPGRPRLERVTLTVPRLPAPLDGLRIGQISDTHLGFRYTADNLAWAVALMQRERPDLVAITGDLVALQSAIPEIPMLLRGLEAPLGVFAVSGNHDYWEGIDDVRAALALCGIPLLRNEHRRVVVEGAELWVAGLDDVWDGEPSLEAALRGVPPQAFTLLLCHEPDYADEAAARGVDVQLSGHAHGGHLRLPLLGPMALPRFGRRYPMGHYRIGPTTLYVARGLGGVPLRFGCPPEATMLTLRRGG